MRRNGRATGKSKGDARGLESAVFLIKVPPSIAAHFRDKLEATVRFAGPDWIALELRGKPLD